MCDEIAFVFSPQPLVAELEAVSSKFGGDEKRNRFQFLNQNLNADLQQSPVRGAGQSGDNYSYSPLAASYESHANGYDYQPPR